MSELENNSLIAFLIIQAAILIGILVINVKIVYEIKKMNERNVVQPQPFHQPPALKNNIIFPLNTKSVNLNKVVKVDKEEEQNHVLVFVSPSCSACKDLFLNTEIEQSMNKKLIVITDSTNDIEFYENILTNKEIPIIEAKELRDHLGIRAFPTVIHVDKNLRIKEYFSGSNFIKFKEYIQSA